MRLFVYPFEQLVIGPVNHAYSSVAFDKEPCTAMILRVSSPMQQRGSRKGGIRGAWLSVPPDKELARRVALLAIAVISIPIHQQESAD